MVLNFVDADTTQKATGATSAQINFVCVICTSNSSSNSRLFELRIDYLVEDG